LPGGDLDFLQGLIVTLHFAELKHPGNDLRQLVDHTQEEVSCDQRKSPPIRNAEQSTYRGRQKQAPAARREILVSESETNPNFQMSKLLTILTQE
jgi:hypothetical protein